MKNLVPLMGLITIVLFTACNSVDTSTPETFGASLINIIKTNDSVAYNDLLVTKEDLVKFMENSKEYKEMDPGKKAIALGLLSIATDNMDKEASSKLIGQDLRYINKRAADKGITDWNKVNIVEIKHSEWEDPGLYWLNIEIKYDTTEYTVRCDKIMNIPGKGFRIFEKRPRIWDSK